LEKGGLLIDIGIAALYLALGKSKFSGMDLKYPRNGTRVLVQSAAFARFRFCNLDGTMGHRNWVKSSVDEEAAELPPTPL
jgi:hypothetical protein